MIKKPLCLHAEERLRGNPWTRQCKKKLRVGMWCEGWGICFGNGYTAPSIENVVEEIKRPEVVVETPPEPKIEPPANVEPKPEAKHGKRGRPAKKK